MFISDITNYLRRHDPFVPKTAITTHLQINSLVAGWISVGRLRRTFPAQVEALINRIQELRQSGYYVRELIVARPESSDQINFQTVPLEVLQDCCDLGVLDLRELGTKLLKFNIHRRGEGTPYVSPPPPPITVISPASVPEPKAPPVAKMIQSTDRYLNSSRLVQLRRTNAEGQKISLSIEFIKNPYIHLAEHNDEVINELFAAFAAAWEPVVGRQLEADFYQKYIGEKYFRRAEKLAILRDPTNRIVGFAAMTKELVKGEPVFYLAGTVLHPAIQGLRFSVRLNRQLIVEAWRQNAHLTGGRIMIATRTANPRVLGALASSIDDVYPNPYLPNRRPDSIRQSFNIALAEKVAAGIPFDAEKQVLRGALTRGVGGLLYQRDDLQLYRDRRVNDLCFRELNYDAGDLFLISGYVSRLTIIKSWFKEQFRSLGDWWRQITFSAFRSSLR